MTAIYWATLPLKRYADFSGRSRRREYWSWVIWQFLLGLLLWIAVLIQPAVVVLYVAFALAFFLPSLAVAVRRLHDTDRSGWWIAAMFVPLVLLYVEFLVMDSSPSLSNAKGIVADLYAGLATLTLIAAGVVALTVVVFMFLRGTPGTNRFGEEPV